MKAFFLTFVLAGFMNLVSAQVGTKLEFNQVLLLSTSANSTVTLGTVPAGKVWKITGFGSPSNGSPDCGLSFDGSNKAMSMGGTFLYNNSVVLSADLADFWLPENTSIYALGCSSTYRWVSVMEFTVLP